MNFGQGGLNAQFWFNGDFDYNGTVNTEDFTMLSNNFGKTLTFSAPPVDAPLPGSLLPEPSFMLIAAALLIPLRRRRAER